MVAAGSVSELEELQPNASVRGIPGTVDHLVERGLGFEPVDQGGQQARYDIESRVPGTAKLRFTEVKGRVSGADTITVTSNEIHYSPNKQDDFILATVEFDGDGHRVHYVRWPFQREPDFGAARVNYNFTKLVEEGGTRLTRFVKRSAPLPTISRTIDAPASCS